MASNMIPLGKKTVAAAGTLEQIQSTNQLCHSIFIQAWPTNTGKVYIFSSSSGSKTTGAGMIGWIGAPTANVAPFFQVSVASAPNGLDIADIWIDVDTNGEGVITTLVEA